MDNCRWDIDSARDRGVIASFLQPLDKPVPMVATTDVGRVAAELLVENWTGRRIVELEGPVRVSPLALAAALGQALGRDVVAQAIPRTGWEPLFRAQGMKHPGPRLRMLDGFNEGWIDFDPRSPALRKGVATAQAVIDDLVQRAR